MRGLELLGIHWVDREREEKFNMAGRKEGNLRG